MISALLTSGGAISQPAADSPPEYTRHLSERAEKQSLEEVSGKGPAATPPRSERCPHAVRGLRFYRSRQNDWARKMGAGDGVIAPERRSHALRAPCPRYLASLWRDKAHAARRAYERWHEYHWNWRKWLPDKWARIGACETGYGRRPGQWTWNSGTYQGFSGFYYGTWDQYRHRADPKAGPYPDDAYEATPRQQYEVALAVWRVHGYGAWGCGGA